MGIVFQKDKRSGLTYAYENHPYWDKEKKQGRSHRTLVGRVDENGNIVPTDGRGRRTAEGLKRTRRQAHVPIDQISRSFLGATCLLDGICRQTGLDADLRACFPSAWREMLSLAYFLVLEEGASLVRFPCWAACHPHPCGRPLGLQECGRLFAAILDEDIRAFFRRRCFRRPELDLLACDSVSFPSLSQALEQVDRGGGELDRPLPLRLRLLFGGSSGLPVCYRRLSGELPEPDATDALLGEIGLRKPPRLTTILDGIVAEEDVPGLFGLPGGFLAAVDCPPGFLRTHLAAWNDPGAGSLSIRSGERIHFRTGSLARPRPRSRPRPQDSPSSDGGAARPGRLRSRLHLHVYFRPGEAAADADGNSLDGFPELLQAEPEGPSPERVGGDSRRPWWLVLVSDVLKDPRQALLAYEARDVAGEAFENLKERLNCRPRVVVSGDAPDGKIFVAFLALVIVSALHRRMQQSDLYGRYTPAELLDELELLQGFSEPGRAPLIGKLSPSQSEIYSALGIDPPAP